jgi:O-antigen/teichoic acid export membrane protein
MDQRPHQSSMKTALQELAGKGIIYGLGASFNGLVSFLLIPFFTGRLTAREYGRYAIAEMVLSLILVLLSLGMHVAILARYPSVPPQDRDRFFGSVLTLMVLWTAAFEGVFLGLARLAGGTAVPVLDMRIFALIAAISTLETIWLLFATLYRAQGAAWRYIGASALQASVGLLATVYAITGLGYRDEGILIGRLAGDVILFAAVLAPQLWRYRPTLDLTPARQLLKIGVPLIPATFASMWVLTSPRYFIQWYGSVGDVGVFAMSSKIAGVLQLIYIQPFAMAWMVSLFTIFKEPDAPRIYARVLTYYVLLGVTLALTVGLVAQGVVPILSRPSFPLSAAIVLAVALAQVASGLMYPLNIGSYVLEQTRKQIPIFVFSGILITIVGIVMVRLWGALGGAVALLLVYVAQAALLARMSQRLYRVAFEWGRIAKVLSALGTAFLLVRALDLVVSPLPLIHWLLAPLFLAAAVLALLAFRFPNPGEWASLRAAVGRLARAP